MIETFIKDLAAMLVKVALAVLFVLSGIQAASALITMRPPMPLPGGLTEGGAALWTAKPTRIDVSQQRYERLPARLPAAPPQDDYPIRMVGNGELLVLDNAQFRWRGTTYRLDGIAPLPRKAVCQSSSGKRTACGLHAFKALDNAMRGKAIACKPTGSAPGLVTCRTGNRDLASLLRPLNG
ncbi:hypothetical protein [Xaviernesmea oryzae]|nr:hypothetical protein [Xaviernesmea oryzae]SEK65532.1 hypothetical protein SAMN04487976_103220 [Xaviernesmea oryzae]